MEYVLLFLTGLAGSCIQGATGFGFGIFVMTILPFFLPAAPLTMGISILGLVNIISILAHKWRYIDYKKMIWPTVAAFIGRYVGVQMLLLIENGPYKIVLGITLIVLSLFFALMSNIRINTTVVNGVAVGLLSGWLGGAFNMSGPPLVFYYLSAIEDKNVYIATIQATMLVSSLFSFGLHIYYGRMSGQALLIAGVGLLSVIVGSRIGLKILNQMNRERLKKQVYFFMFLMGIVMSFSNR